MTTFETPNPISVDVEVGIGSVTVAASDRTDTVVDVRPSDPGKRSDVSAAERTRVELSAGRLVVHTPKQKGLRLWGASRESVDICIELPSGSSVTGEGGVAGLATSGHLRDVTYKAGVGDVRVEDATSVAVKCGVGTFSATRISGTADIKTASGNIDIGTVTGSAVVKNSNGSTNVGAVDGDLRVQAANGRIVIGRASRTVVAKTANGDVRVGVAGSGPVTADTAFGQIDVAVEEGIAVWLDLHTHFGNVNSQLDRTEKPEPGEKTAEIRARTAFGDITVHRMAPFSSQSGAA